MNEHNTNSINLINIMYGLPGSGKTYYCSREVMNNSKAVCIHMDQCFRAWQWRKSKRTLELEEWLPDEINRCIMCWPEAETLYLDGLCTTYDVLKKIIKCVSSVMKRKYSVTVHVWDENRELCMINDGGRRRESSSASIMNLPYDTIKTKEDVEDAVIAAGCYMDDFACSVHMHKVIEKPKWKQMFAMAREDVKDFSSYSSKRSDYRSFSDSEKWYSNRWCLGGEGRSYTGAVYRVGADENTELSEVMDFLEDICSQLTLHDFRKIMEECVTIETEKESDYYGGTVAYARYVISLPGAYDIISDGSMKKE